MTIEELSRECAELEIRVARLEARVNVGTALLRMLHEMDSPPIDECLEEWAHGVRELGLDDMGVVL